jgi:hypothetical protein
MGVFNKLKSIFYDEVVVEDETQELDKVSKIVKKETSSNDDAPKVEELRFKTIEMDPVEEEKEEKKEETKEEPLSDRDLFRSERSFNFVDWDNDEEEKLPPRKNVLDDTSRVARSTEPARDDTPKVFKPTPVISPIWGVLDKDYKKDEIKEKTIGNEAFSSSITEYDNVRRKAYGTLEDELEDTLNKVSTKDIKAALDKEEDSTLDSRTAKIEDLIDKIDEATDELDKSMSIEEAENNVKIDNFDDEDEAEEELSNKTLADSTLEHDLFNLIDSMYDKEE